MRRSTSIDNGVGAPRTSLAGIMNTSVFFSASSLRRASDSLSLPEPRSRCQAAQENTRTQLH